MDNATDTNHLKTYIIRSAILILFSLILTFSYQRMRLNGKIQRLENEIQSIETPTAEIQKTLPTLRKISEQVLAITDLVPRRNTAAWCDHIVNFPYLPESFKRTHSILEPKIPIQMELSRELRDAGKHLQPAIIPFQVEVKVVGTLIQLAYFLNEIDHQYQKMVVSRIDLRPVGDSDLFKGSLTLTFPQIQYPEDIEEISQFVKKDSGEIVNLAELNEG